MKRRKEMAFRWVGLLMGKAAVDVLGEGKNVPELRLSSYSLHSARFSSTGSGSRRERFTGACLSQSQPLMTILKSSPSARAASLRDILPPCQEFSQPSRQIRVTFEREPPWVVEARRERRRGLVYCESRRGRVGVRLGGYRRGTY